MSLIWYVDDKLAMTKLSEQIKDNVYVDIICKHLKDFQIDFIKKEGHSIEDKRIYKFKNWDLL